MDFLHHKPIKQYRMNGNIHDESAIPRLRMEYIRLLTTEMRMSGYVPRLDIDPDFTLSYNEIKQNFTFNLSIYGSYIGRKKSEWISGIDGTKLVPIVKNKSNELSQDQESQSNQK
jgi:hypothetical protein